jgi:hypothetical protein
VLDTCPECASDRTMAVAGHDEVPRLCLVCGTRWTISGARPVRALPQRRHPSAAGTGRERRATPRSTSGHRDAASSLTLVDRDTVVRETIESLPEPLARRVLHALSMPPHERAGLIGRLWRDSSSREFAEFLAALEEDREFALALARALRERVAAPDR